MINEIGASTASAAQAAASAPGGKLGKDEFLKMLVAQMRNQDPLNPMKGDEMAAQLAQFSSLEQLTSISAGLEGLTEVMSGQMLQTMHATSAMGALGRTVLAETDRVELGASEAPAVTLELGGRGATASLRILDANGEVVGKRELGPLSAGRHSIEVGSAGQGLPAGVYRFEVQVADAAGAPVETATFVRTRIDGVRYGPNGPILTSGGLSFPLGSVLEIGSD